MPVARFQRPTEPAGETTAVSPLELNYICISPSRACKGMTFAIAWAREGVRGWGIIHSQSKVADETRVGAT